MDFSKEYLRQEYKSRINNVQDYIDKHLGDELTAAKLSEVANFSPFHFHRIFGAMTGETLYQYILRIRLEKSASLLITNPKKTVTEIAMECGFTSSATYARAFKQFYGVSASKWVKNPVPQNSRNCKTDSSLCKTDSKYCKDGNDINPYNKIAAGNGNAENIIWEEYSMENKNFTVEVKTISDMPVVYVRHTGPYKGDNELFEGLHEKLYKWAGPRGLINFPETRALTVYHDNPELTDENKLRISVCLSAPADTQVDGEIGKMVISGGKYAVGHFEIKSEQYPQAWGFMYGSWFPESGYQPDDGVSFELYLNDPKEHPENLHIVDIYIPVKPL